MENRSHMIFWVEALSPWAQRAWRASYGVRREFSLGTKRRITTRNPRPWLLPGGIFLSSFLTSLVGMSHSVPCNKEWCILQGIQSDSHIFITLLPTSEGLLACESIKVLPSLQVISIKHLLLHIGWGPVFWLDEGENEKGELNLHVDYWPWVICHILYISVRCTYFKSSFIQPIFVVLGSPQNSAVNKTADVLWWS